MLGYSLGYTDGKVLGSDEGTAKAGLKLVRSTRCGYGVDVRRRLSDFGSAFLHLNTRNGGMPLNTRPKRPPYVVFFVLYKFRVVCVLY